MKLNKSILVGVTALTLSMGFSTIAVPTQSTVQASVRRARVIRGVRVYHFIRGAHLLPVD